MAEFVETMRKLREMCKGQKNCRNCTMFIGGLECGASLGSPNLPVEEIERRVAQWEAEKYPTWYEFQVVRFPNHTRWICPMAFGVTCPNNGAGSVKDCTECRDNHIPAEIAEKLGIKPKEG